MTSFRFDFISDESTATQQQGPSVSTETERQKVNPFIFCENPCWLERACDTQEWDVLPLHGLEPLKKCRLIRGGGASHATVEAQQSDILPGVYEGGMKVWECSIDLCNYLAKNVDMLTPNYCLEIGCGQALPACLIFRESIKQTTPSFVVFTDYNDFVINDVTITNIVLNTPASDGIFPLDYVAKHAIVGHGDWMDMSNQLLTKTHGLASLPIDGRFDLILAAETTYTAGSARDTITLLARHLVPETGVGLVATKRYYFGVGGGSDALRDAARNEQIFIQGTEYMVLIEKVQEFEDGTSNIRDILKVILLPKSAINT